MVFIYLWLFILQSLSHIDKSSLLFYYKRMLSSVVLADPLCLEGLHIYPYHVCPIIANLIQTEFLIADSKRMSLQL